MAANNLFRNEPVITDQKRFTQRVYDFLDNVNIEATDLTTVNARLTALESADTVLAAADVALDIRVDVLEANDNYRRTFLLMGA